MAEPPAGREEARRLRPTRGLAHDRPVPSDVEAITALIMAYAERLDAGDLDGVAALFAHASRGHQRRGRAGWSRPRGGALLLHRLPGAARLPPPADPLRPLPGRVR